MTFLLKSLITNSKIILRFWGYVTTELILPSKKLNDLRVCHISYNNQILISSKYQESLSEIKNACNRRVIFKLFYFFFYSIF